MDDAAERPPPPQGMTAKMEQGLAGYLATHRELGSAYLTM